jgi:hypothetical protein
MAPVVTERWQAATERFNRLLAVWLDTPLREAGFRDSRGRWVRGRGDVLPFVDVQRNPTAQLERGFIEFTINWGVWILPFAASVSNATRPSPRSVTAPFAARIGDLLSGDEDAWWRVSAEGTTRARMFAPNLAEPSAQDEVPAVISERLVPMIAPVETIPQAIDAIIRWRAEGVDSCVTWWFDPVERLTEIASSA